MGHLDDLGRTFRGAGAAALTQGLVDLRDIILVDLRDAVGAGPDAHQAGGAPARAAAAMAWAMLSPISLGECAMPHRKMPSEAKSTGRSLAWASMKNPPAFRGIFRSEANSSVSLARAPALNTTASTAILTGRSSTWSTKVTLNWPLSLVTWGKRSGSNREK